MSFDTSEWWQKSGGAWLTGRSDGPCLRPTGDVAAYVVATLDGVAPTALGADLLFGRAAFTGAHRDGATATGGTARMLRALDGWVAVNLARPADLSAVAAIVEGDDGGDPFAAIDAWAAHQPAASVAERAQLFGVPAGVVGSVDASSGVVRRVVGERDVADRVRVGDLTSLWAGPTCARLLGRRGAHVTKIESVERPDGARRGSAGFYRWLHAYDARNLSFPFTTEAGRAGLRAALDDVDVVLESSRPRALRQLGVVAEEWLAARPGRVWLSITAYGRDEDEPGRVGFGDDAAAAGGLVAYEPDGDTTPLFVGDAIADPLTGITAARAITGSLAAGGGELISVALAGVAARVVTEFPQHPSVIYDAAPPEPPKPDM